MTRSIATLAALSAAVLAFSPMLAAPAQASSGGAYTVRLASALDGPRREIIKGEMWQCAGETCRAKVSGSRPETTCKRVVKEFGAVAEFAGPTGAFDAAAIAECNGDTAKSVARK